MIHVNDLPTKNILPRVRNKKHLETNQYQRYFRKTSEYLDKVFNEKVKKCVPGFANASLKSKSILMNTGPAKEQKAHSDYSVRGGV